LHWTTSGQSGPFRLRAELEAHLNQTTKIMKKLLLSLTLGMAAVGIATPKAQAVEISGVIQFAGKAVLNGPVGTATGVTSWSSSAPGLVAGKANVVDASGDFAVAGLAGTLATFNAPWLFNSGLNPLWTAGTFVFNLTSSAITAQNSSTVSASGSGIVTAPGFDPTAGTWNFSTQPGSINGAFSFSASSEVPEGGSAVAMLGMGLLGLAGVRKKLAKTA
jgi:hypothetical protein